MSDKSCISTCSNGCFRKVFLKCKYAIKSRCTGQLASLVDREFHALFTFMMVLIAKLVYLRWLLSGGPIAENNFLSRYISYLHIALFLISSAILRCLVGYLLQGGHMQQGGTFDYPENGHNADKSNKEQTSPAPSPPSALSDPDSEDEAKISKDFSGKSV